MLYFYFSLKIFYSFLKKKKRSFPLESQNPGPILCAVPWRSVSALWKVPCIVEVGGLETNTGFSVKLIGPICVLMRDRCGFQLLLTLPHFTAIFPSQLLARLALGPTPDTEARAIHRLSSSHDFVRSNP